MEFGMQMFGAAAAFRKDPEEFLRRMSEIGLSIIEPCVFLGGEVPSFGEGRAVPFWSEEEIIKYSEDMKKYGQKIITAHIFCKDFESALPAMKNVAEKTGLKAYVINVPAPAIENPDKYAVIYSDLAKKLAEFGVELWLHNSGNDFRTKIEVDGEEMPVYEYLLNKAEGTYAQVDTGWVLVGGIKPEDFMKKHIDKLRCIHFKELAKGFENLKAPEIFAVLGDGVTDVKACLSVEPEDESIPVIIDQDMPISGDIFADMEKTIQVIKSI